MATGRVPTTANSPLTAKGDLFGYSTTQARVPVGNDGETLVADSSASTGLRWTATPSASNPVVNGGMDIWQRGTSISNTSVAGLYTADRWMTQGTPAAFTISRQATGDTTNLPFIQYCARIQRNSGQTNVSTFDFLTGFETVNSIPFAGKTITFSFYARAGANYSPTSSLLAAAVYSGTGTDQTPNAAFTGQGTVINQNATLTTTWQRFTYTASVPSSVTQLKIIFSMTPTGTASTNDYYEVTGVQLDVGSVALPFRRSGNTLAGELAACQRYYRRKTSVTAGANAYMPFATGRVESTSNAYVMDFFPVPMRTTPSFSGSGSFALYTVGATTGLTLVGDQSSVDGATITVIGSGMTAGRAAILQANNNNTCFIEWSAEL